MYSARELATIARLAGFPARSVAMAVAISLAESGGRVHARCLNSGHGCGASPRTALSTDRCLWQINDRAHPWSRRGNIDDPMTCARAALRISHRGRDWRPWSTYLSGSYRRHWAAAVRAARV